MAAPAEWDVIALGLDPVRAVEWWERRRSPARVLAACADERRAATVRGYGSPPCPTPPSTTSPTAGRRWRWSSPRRGEAGAAALAAAARLARDAVAVVHRDVPRDKVLAVLDGLDAPTSAYAGCRAAAGRSRSRRSARRAAPRGSRSSPCSWPARVRGPPSRCSARALRVAGQAHDGGAGRRPARRRRGPPPR